MDKKYLTYLKEHKNAVIVSLILCFIILFSLFFTTYNSTENKIKRNLKDLAQELTIVNSSLSDCIKDLTIDTNVSKNVLSNGVNNLNTILKSVSEINESSLDISLAKSNLSNAINSTINLYSNALIFLSDSKSIRTTDDLNKFNILKEECILNYSTLATNNINVEFSKESLTFIDNFYNYLNILIKINRDSDFNISQKREFINTLENFNKDLTYLNEDLSLAISKVREDKRDLTVIIDDIFNKEKIFSNIKEKSLLISIPDGCMDIHESFTEYLNFYSAYIKSIKEAVIYEKTSSDLEKYSNEVDKNYKNSKSKLNDTLNAFEEYQNKLKNNLY